MKKKDLISIKSKSISELSTMGKDIQNQISRAKMEMAVRKAKNTNIAKGLSKTLAQILTIKKEKELATGN